MKYGNPDVDRLWALQSKEMDVAKRADLTRQIERLLIGDSVFISGTNTRYWIGWRPYVKGFYAFPMLYSNKLAMEQVWFDK